MTEPSKRARMKANNRALRRMSKTGCFVYVLTDALDGSPAYVGQTRTALDIRLRNHLKEAIAGEREGRKLSPVHGWIIGLISTGKMPVIRMIDDCGTWDISEAVWIDRYTRQGIQLLNINARVP